MRTNERKCLMGKCTNKQYPKERGCGGSIVGRKFVLSAAHCVFEKKKINDVKVVTKKYTNTDLAVRIGGHKLNDNTFTGHEKFCDISEIVVHPNYINYINVPPCRLEDCPHDLVIFILEENLDLNFYTPVCLPLSSEVRKFDGRLMTLAGWGNTISPKSKTTFPNVPSEAKITVFKPDDCPESAYLPSQLCAGQTDASNRGTCSVSKIR